MGHLIDTVFTHTQREKVLALVDEKLGFVFTGSDEDIRSAKLLLGKLLLVDRKGADTLLHFEKVAIGDYIAIVDAEEFLEEYTETLNIDDIIRMELIDGDIAEALIEAPDSVFTAHIIEVQEIISDLKNKLGDTQINLHNTDENYLKASAPYLYYLRDWADLVRTAVIYSLHAFRLDELGDELLTAKELDAFIKTLPNGVLDYLSLNLEDTIKQYLHLLLTTYPEVASKIKVNEK